MEHLATYTSAEIEEADFRQVANPSNVTVLPTGCTRGEAIQHLSRGIPSNEYGLPFYYIRSDLLDWAQIEAYGHVDQETVEAASEVLSYEEGYPCQKAGSPWWIQLQHEPYDAFLLFKGYLALSEDEGIRLLDTLAFQENIPLQNLRQFSLEFYWSARSRAYDLFIVAAEAKKREARTRRTENSHFNIAGGILDTIVSRINDEPDLINSLPAADLFELFEKMVKVQRLSLGLTGANASTNPSLPMSPGASVEVVLRQLTHNVGLSSTAETNVHDRIKMLMGDESTALKAQELVIRATTNNLVHSG